MEINGKTIKTRKVLFDKIPVGQYFSCIPRFGFIWKKISDTHAQMVVSPSDYTGEKQIRELAGYEMTIHVLVDWVPAGEELKRLCKSL